MTTHLLTATPTSGAALRVRAAFRWVRETPAPRWEGDAAHKAGYVAYVAGSAVAWTVLGLAVTAGLGDALVALAG